MAPTRRLPKRLWFVPYAPHWTDSEIEDYYARNGTEGRTTQGRGKAESCSNPNNTSEPAPVRR